MKYLIQILQTNAFVTIHGNNLFACVHLGKVVSLTFNLKNPVSVQLLLFDSAWMSFLWPSFLTPGDEQAQPLISNKLPASLDRYDTRNSNFYWSKLA